MPLNYDVRTVQRLYQSYEELKTDRHLIDFEDVLLLTVAVLEEDERVAATVREQYRHFVVDEYQDVSPLQQRLRMMRFQAQRPLQVGRGSIHPVQPAQSAGSEGVGVGRGRFQSHRPVEFGGGVPVAAEISQGGAAESAGLRKGDVVTEFNGVAITDRTDLTAQVRFLAGGSEAELTYVRDGRTETTTVTLDTLES